MKQSAHCTLTSLKEYCILYICAEVADVYEGFRSVPSEAQRFGRNVESVNCADHLALLNPPFKPQLLYHNATDKQLVPCIRRPEMNLDGAR
jgi:hypothetical protein